MTKAQFPAFDSTIGLSTACFHDKCERLTNPDRMEWKR
jgi:hypothetical protein